MGKAKMGVDHSVCSGSFACDRNSGWDRDARCADVTGSAAHLVDPVLFNPLLVWRGDM